MSQTKNKNDNQAVCVNEADQDMTASAGASLFSEEHICKEVALYSKTCVKQPLKNRQNIGLNRKW